MATHLPWSRCRLGGVTERALIYARGGDSNLREICGQLLVEGLALRAELHSTYTMYLERPDYPKMSTAGRIMVVEVEAAQVEICLGRMKSFMTELGDEGFSAVAVPVIAAV